MNVSPLLDEVFSAFFGTGELLPEGVALFPAGPSSQEDVEEPDSSSELKVGG